MNNPATRESVARLGRARLNEPITARDGDSLWGDSTMRETL